jgi:hypothetical protein
MLDALTASQVAGWHWYMEEEPFGFPALDAWHGLQCATYLALHMPKGKRAEPTSFMLRPPPPRELTPEETVAFFRAALGRGVRTS